MQEYDQDIIIQKIIAFLDGTISREDTLLLQQWINQSEKHQTYYRQMKNIYEMSDRRLNPADIRIDQALQTVFRKIASTGKVVRLSGWLQKIAAILFIPLFAVTLYLVLNNRNADIPVNYCEVQAAAGLRSSIILPDNTKVWINSGSKLRYPDRFTENERNVYVEGEAYFEVTASTEKPFIVHTPNIRVKATGTKFSITDFLNDHIKEVTLVSGKVSVGKVKDDIFLAEMQPDQHLVYDLSLDSIGLLEGDTYRYYAWKDNKMVFRNDPMSDVVKRISQLYGIEIELQGEEIKNYRYRATFEEESLYEILKLLKMSAPINYREVKREQNADGSFSAPKIIIYQEK